MPAKSKKRTQTRNSRSSMSTGENATGTHVGEIDEVSDSSPNMQVSMAELLTKMDQLSTSIKSDVCSIKSEVSSLKTDFVMVKGEFTKLQKDIVSIKSELADIKNGMSSVKDDVVSTNSRVTKTESTIVDIEKWIENRESVDSDLFAKYTACDSNMSDLKDQTSTLKSKLENSEKAYSDLRQYTLRLETQSRRDNLVFDGVPEKINESDKDCYDEIIKIVSEMNITGLETDKIRVARCHRMGPKNSHRPRSIIVKFHWYGDRRQIWDAKTSLKHVRGGTIFMSENFPPEIEKQRRVLYPVLKAARKMDDKAHIAVNKLIVRGKSYTVANLNLLPPELDPRKIATPSKDGITAFFNSQSPLSNFYPAPVKHSDGTVYRSSEHMYQHQKALYHNNDSAATKIINASSAYEAHKAGMEVKSQPNSDWYTGKELGKEMMFRSCLVKFSDNQVLQQFLLDTHNTELVEGNPYDDLWGVKVHAQNSAIFDKKNWNGKNWMGDVLTRVRDCLKNKNS